MDRVEDLAQVRVYLQMKYGGGQPSDVGAGVPIPLTNFMDVSLYLLVLACIDPAMVS